VSEKLQTLVPGLKARDLTLGAGDAQVERGDIVTVHYRGFLNRGDLFGDSGADGRPLLFEVGKRQMIAGVERGVIGMRVGGRRELIVSPHLAYRDTAVPGIPPNAVLRFEVELLNIRKPGMHLRHPDP